MPRETISDDVVAIIRDVLQQELKPFGLGDVEIAAGPDHDGEPSILIDARYENDDRPIDPKVVVGLTTKLRDRLWEKGEERFPYVHHHFAEHRKVVGYR